MPADPHPFQHPDPVQAQAARDKARPMAPKAGDMVFLRKGIVGFTWTPHDEEFDARTKTGVHPGKPELDIIATVDPATGRVTRTAEGVVDAPVKAGAVGLDALVERAREWWLTASDAEKAAMIELQKASWVRANVRGERQAVAALSAPPDTTAAVIEAAKAVVDAHYEWDVQDARERLAAAIAAHEARHG